MPHPVPLPKNLATMLAGGLAAVAAFVTLAGATGHLTPAADTGSSTPTTTPAACPAGTVETATDCVKTVEEPAAPEPGAPAGDPAAPDSRSDRGTTAVVAHHDTRTRAPRPAEPSATQDPQVTETGEPSAPPPSPATSSDGHHEDATPEPQESEPGDD